MNEEEKKAIENLKKELNQYEYTKDLDLASDNYFGQFEEKINIVTIILNLIEKQQKEIENLKEINKEHQKINGELEEENTRQHELLGNIHQNYREEIENLKELMAHKNGYTKQLEEDLFENASNYVVSKDKIREKIEEINDEKLNYSEDEYYLESEEKGYAIDKLKELLEEE